MTPLTIFLTGIIITLAVMLAVIIILGAAREKRKDRK